MITPRENPNLTGQDAAETAFLKRWDDVKMPHAWLITGPKGVGKATFAYRLARFVLKEGDISSLVGGGLLFDDAPPSSLQVSENDPVFSRVVQGSHTDLQVLEPEEGKTNISVESARKVGQFLSLTPAESSWRVVIVDSADDMNTNAANALLKILEEPPSQALLFLVSHVPGKLLPTIRSRCQPLALQPLPETGCNEVLDRLGIGRASAEDRALACALAGGAPGRMVELLDGDGLETIRSLFALLGTLPQLDMVKTLQFTASLGNKDKHLLWRQVVQAFFWWLERATRHIAMRQAPSPECFDGEFAVMQAMRDAQPLDYWVEMWEKARGWLRSTETLHLDRKQVLASFLFALRDAITHQPNKLKVAL